MGTPSHVVTEQLLQAWKNDKSSERVNCKKGEPLCCSHLVPHTDCDSVPLTDLIPLQSPVDTISPRSSGVKSSSKPKNSSQKKKPSVGGQEEEIAALKEELRLANERNASLQHLIDSGARNDPAKATTQQKTHAGRIPTTLPTLAQDCIASLIHYLPGEAFVSLMMSGNRLLRHKLRLSCFALFFEPRPASDFPFAALALPNLRTLSVKGMLSYCTYLDFRKGGDLALARGHRTLEKIDLDFCNSPGLFVLPESTIPRLPIRDRFPSLTTLIMSNIICDWRLHRLFGELPETLTNLSLAFSNTTEAPELDVRSISKLPRHLTTLKLNHVFISAANDANIDYKNMFPPNLLHLDIDIAYDEEIPKHWPSTLQSIRFSNGGAPKTILASWIPKKLKRLEYCDKDDDYQHDRHQLNLDVPLPQSLEIFDFTTLIVVGNPPFTLADLPRGVKQIPKHFFSRGNPARWSHNNELLTLESVLQRYYKLEKVSIKSPVPATCLPIALKWLKLKIPHSFSSPLPSGLTYLQLRVPLPSHSLKYLPPTIQTLIVGIPPKRTVRAAWDYSETQSGYPPWDSDDIAILASKLCLVTFSTEMRFIQRCSCLSPLAKVETLKNFKINYVSLEDMLLSPNWLPKCLPRNLEELEIVYQASFLNEQPKKHIEGDLIPDDFLRLCNLAEVTPHLKSLTLEYRWLRPLLLGPSFASLPRGLVTLVINSFFAELTPDACRLLPRSLIDFNIWIPNQVRNQISNRHLEGLPPSIASLSLNFDSKAAIDEGLLTILPPNLFRAVIGQADASSFREWGRLLFDPLEELIHSHDLVKGFTCNS